MVVIWTWPGNTLLTTVLPLTHASHTLLVQVSPQHAQTSALTVQPCKDSSAPPTQSDNLRVLPKSNLKSFPTVQSKVPSLSTLISSTINQVSTPQPPPMLPVVTPSRSSVTVLKTVPPTGSAPTHGAQHGECQVSSRSSKESAALRTKSSHATHNSEQSELTDSLVKGRSQTKSPYYHYNSITMFKHNSLLTLIIYAYKL